MNFVQSINVVILIVTTLGLVYPTKAQSQTPVQVSKTIVVDLNGYGQFKSIQNAIDSIPPGNTKWVRVQIKPGIYNEKVIIPKEKPYINLVGEDRRTTVIQVVDYGSSTESAALILHADNFIAKGISFRNSHDIGKLVMQATSTEWAPAATIDGDKVSFYRCGFASILDTLTDFRGRHYYKECYIEGAVDFIWGYGQSVFKNCVINATTGIFKGSPGFITAQGRDSADDPEGFVFLSSKIVATGPVYLGRTYKPYSRVVIKDTFLPPQIVPLGWEIWRQQGHESKVTVAEVNCTGPGANKSRRVKWVKELSGSELNDLTEINKFINQDGWIQSQPRT